MDARFMQMHNLVLTREVIIYSMLPVDRTRELNFHLETAVERRNELCKRLFDSIANNSGHKLHNLLPPRNEQSYCLRQQRTYNLPRSRTDRFRQSFVYAMSKDA